MYLLILNSSLLLIAILWWSTTLPERAHLSSLVISFALILLTVWMQGCVHRMGNMNNPSIIDHIAMVWFVVICGACIKMIFSDRFPTKKARIRAVPKAFRRPID